MTIGVDLRCLQDSWLTGVGEYAGQTLSAITAQAKSIQLIGYANAAKKINWPSTLEDNIKIVRQRLPNRLNNLLFTCRWGVPLDIKLSQRGGSIDVIWLPNPGFIYLSAEQPAILTVHDLSFVHWPEFFKWRSHLWYFRAVKKLLKQIPLTNMQVACVSRHTADDLLSFVPGLQREKIHVIYPGVTADYYIKPSVVELNAFKAKYNLPRRYLLSLGTIEPRKNYELLIRAYEEILKSDSNFSADLVITGPWGWKNHRLKKILAYARQSKRIHFLGYVAATDKPLLYAGASLFLYPSFYEGFGIPPLEAMTQGTPVITSLTSSLPEVVGKAGIMLTPYDYKPWVEAIRWLSDDATARQKFSTLSQARARQFSWQKTARQYVDLFRRVAGEK